MKKLRQSLESLQGIRAAAVTLAVGAVGGFIALLLHVPTPWMIGSMLATMVCTLSGVPLRLSAEPQRLTSVLISAMIGCSFTADIFANAGRWGISMMAVAVFTVIATLAIAQYLSRVARFGPVTSFFASAPGDVANMVIAGRAMGGDDRVIALVHALRMALLTLIVPFALLLAGTELSGTTVRAHLVDLTIFDGGILLACAVGGYFLGCLVKSPLGIMFAPMILSAIAHLTGFTSARAPSGITDISQIVIGAGVGCRFFGYGIRRVIQVLGQGGVSNLLLLLAAGGVAWALSVATGLNLTALVLSFAPGSLSQMTLISLSMGLDTAFVTTHHIVRLICIIVVTPILCKMMIGRMPPRDEAADAEKAKTSS